MFFQRIPRGKLSFPPSFQIAGFAAQPFTPLAAGLQRTKGIRIGQAGQGMQRRQGLLPGAFRIIPRGMPFQRRPFGTFQRRPFQRRGAFSPFRLQARGVQGVSGFPRFPPQGRDAHFRRVQRPVQAFRPLKSGVESGPGTFQHRAAFFRAEQPGAQTRIRGVFREKDVFRLRELQAVLRLSGEVVQIAPRRAARFFPVQQFGARLLQFCPRVPQTGPRLVFMGDAAGGVGVMNRPAQRAGNAVPQCGAMFGQSGHARRNADLLLAESFISDQQLFPFPQDAEFFFRGGNIR